MNIVIFFSLPPSLLGLQMSPICSPSSEPFYTIPKSPCCILSFSLLPYLFLLPLDLCFECISAYWFPSPSTFSLKSVWWCKQGIFPNILFEVFVRGRSNQMCLAHCLQCLKDHFHLFFSLDFEKYALQRFWGYAWSCLGYIWWDSLHEKFRYYKFTYLCMSFCL